MSKDPYHKARDSFRVLGPTMIVIGGLMLIIGVGQFILSMIQAMSGGNAKPPILFVALGVPGLLIFGIGMQLTGVGFLKQTTKYVAKESAPAAQITTTAIRSALLDDDIPCPSCATPIEPDSKFCSNCGFKVAKMNCPSCNASIDTNARFCSDCGQALESSTA